MTYGLLFRNEAISIGLGVPWAFLFGVIWWYIGPLTLLPLILTGVYDWRASAAAALFPSLIGHLIYGGATALYSSCWSGAISDGCFSIHALQLASSVAFVRQERRPRHCGSSRLGSEYCCQFYLVRRDDKNLFGCVATKSPSVRENHKIDIAIRLEFAFAIHTSDVCDAVTHATFRGGPVSSVLSPESSRPRAPVARR